MYYGRRGLGFSLLPPKSVRNAISSLFTSAVSAGTRAANQRIDASFPAPAPSLMESVPGGMGTLVGVGVGVAALALLLGRRR